MSFSSIPKIPERLKNANARLHNPDNHRISYQPIGLAEIFHE